MAYEWQSGRWTEVESEETLRQCLAFARGSYQENLLRGTENLSGSSLQGKAKNYGGIYQASARSLFSRLQAAGFICGERKAAHGARILTIKTPR
jgi:hypothetical protein